MDKDRVAPRPEARAWTRIDEYVGALVRERRALRSRRRAEPRSEPEAPRASLSTLPFLALIVALGVLAAAVIVLAWPKSEPPRPHAAAHEAGKAEPGWFDTARNEMR